MRSSTPITCSCKLFFAEEIDGWMDQIIIECISPLRNYIHTVHTHTCVGTTRIGEGGGTGVYACAYRYLLCFSASNCKIWE